MEIHQMQLRTLFAVVFVSLTAACSGGDGGAETAGAGEAAMTAAPSPQLPLIELWEAGTPAFGIFAPSDRPMRGPDGERQPPVYSAEGGARMAMNPLLDYVFLNLEYGYDPASISAIREGLDSSDRVSDKALLVRIPPISTDGVEAARTRVHEALEAGADGIVLPHVRSTEEARQAVGFFEEVNADVWSPSNPDGSIIAMLMIEDPGALAEAAQIADVPGYSVLACGIGSLSAALGDREAGEAGNQEVLVQAKRAGLPDMITANADDVARRIEEGFLGLLMNGPEADAHIEVGRAAAGR
jgi:2-keto-3-deoxy-L-rhamnonate aldolase RhmA